MVVSEYFLKHGSSAISRITDQKKKKKKKRITDKKISKQTTESKVISGLEMDLVVHGLSFLLHPSVSSIVGFTHSHFLGDLTPSTSTFLSHISNFFFLYYSFFDIRGTQVPLHKNNEQNHHLLISVSTSTHHRHGLTF